MKVASQNITTPGAVAFEVERFGWGDDRIEVSGRWSGVRGRRFFRPTLTLEDGTRLLAVLDHKPWPADADAWVAAFPWAGERCELHAAVLGVAPGIDVPLPTLAAGGEVRESRPRRTTQETRFARDPAPGSLPTPPDPEPTPVPAAEPPRVASDGEIDVLRERLATAENARAAAELERDNAVAARDAALARRDEAAREQHVLELERDEAVAARARLLAERDEARADSDAHERQRDRAERQREGMERERDRAVAERDSLRRERAAIAPTDELRRAIFRREPDEPPAVLWATRAAAIGALLAGLTLLWLFFQTLAG